MEEIENYNLTLTSQPFDGELRRGRGAKLIYDEDNKIMGSALGKSVYDLNGNKIALYSRTEKTEDGGKRVKQLIYDAEGGEYRLADGKFYRYGKLCGTVEVTERNAAHILLLAAMALFLTAVIIFTALIGTPFDGRPIADIKDENGSWEAQTVVGVFDDKVLPGSGGEYGFIVRNPHDVTLYYSFSIRARYVGELETDYFPITFRLKMNNAVIGTQSWLTAEELNYSELLILPESEQAFGLEWRWAFDGGNDENDTLIGADGGKISLVLELTAQAGDN